MNNLEFAKKMQVRTMDFAVKVVKFFAKLPRTDEARVPGKQLLRAGTSVAANYRAVCRAKSDADFISKMGTVVEEADESAFWLELMENAASQNSCGAWDWKKGSRVIRCTLSLLRSMHGYAIQATSAVPSSVHSSVVAIPIQSERFSEHWLVHLLVNKESHPTGLMGSVTGHAQSHSLIELLRGWPNRRFLRTPSAPSLLLAGTDS